MKDIKKSTNQLVDEKAEKIVFLLWLLFEEVVDKGECLSSDVSEGVERKHLYLQEVEPQSYPEHNES